MNSASGRAVMHWFGADERGLALGVRQTAVPLGGLIAALAVPQVTSPGDATNGFLFFAAMCVVGAVVGAARSSDERVGEHELEQATVVQTLRDARLWRLSVGSGSTSTRRSRSSASASSSSTTSTGSRSDTRRS